MTKDVVETATLVEGFGMEMREGGVVVAVVGRKLDVSY